jgi:hypothetical protein
MTSPNAPVRAVGRLAPALLLALAAVFSTAGVASALPTAEFTFTPAAPALGQPVVFTFTGTCDTPPCSVSWRWFQTGGSRLGTAMGTGERVTYTFPHAGEYSVVAKITNGGSTHGSATATHTLSVQDTFDDDDHQVRYDGWRGVTDPRAGSGGYRTSSSTSDVASYAFPGTQVSYVARTGPDKGIAAVTVPGRPRALVDLYSARAGTTSLSLTGLSDTTHRIRVQPTGTRNPASTGTGVTLDEFVAGTTPVDDRASAVDYNDWRASSNPQAAGGSARSNRTAGASTSFTFSGPSVTWLSFQGPAQGRAAVVLDGRRVETVDGYAATSSWKVAHTYAGLTTGRHVIRVVVLGTRNPSSVGDRVTSDAFVLG